MGTPRSYAARARWCAVLSLTLSVSFGHTWAAFAQEPPPEVQPVVTGTRTEETAADAVVRTDVVTRERTVVEGSTHIGEALDHVVGVYQSPLFGLMMDGLGLSRILVVEDGERVLLDDPSELPLTDTERIEVVRGPLGSIWGYNAMGGVVNLVTEAPIWQKWSGLARIEGRHRWGALLTRTISLRHEQMWATFDAVLYGADSVNLEEGGREIVVPSTKRQAFVFRAGMKVTPKFEADARFRYSRNSVDDLDLEIGEGGVTRVFDEPTEAHRISARFRGILDLGPGHDLTMTAGTQWLIRSLDRDVRDSLVFEAGSSLHSLHAIEATASFGKQWPVSFIVGTRAEVERLARDLEEGSLNRPSVELAPVDPTLIARGSGYAEVRWDPVESVTWLAGVRAEGTSRYDPIVAPRAAVSVRHADWFILGVQGGRGYRSPTPNEMGIASVSSRVGRILRSDDLDAETSWNLNGDLEFRPLTGLRLRTRGYVHWIDDAIELTPIAGLGAPSVRFENIGKERLAGFEADASYAIDPAIAVGLGYAFLHARDLERDEDLPGRPPHGIWASFHGNFPPKVGQQPSRLGFSFVTKLRYVTGATPLTSSSIETPGYALFDARFGKSLWPGSELYVGGLNLIGVERSRLAGDLRPAEGRTIYLGLRFGYPLSGT